MSRCQREGEADAEVAGIRGAEPRNRVSVEDPVETGECREEGAVGSPAGSGREGFRGGSQC